MNINKLISKLFLSKNDYEEKQALESWKQDTTDNLHALQEMIRINELSDTLRDYKQVDVKRAWNNVEEKISDKTPVVYMRKIRNIAAVLLLLIAAIFSFQYVNSHTSATPTLITTNVIKDVNLRDGSSILLDASSNLYEESYRKVTLNGRAYFKIAPDTSIPFKIKLNHGEITVVGTEFNIISNDTFTQIYVTEGIVKYDFNKNSYMLKAGDLITTENNVVNQITSPLIKPDSWRNGSLTFENESLHSVLSQVAVYYNYQLVNQTGMKNDPCKINTIFKNEKLLQVLKELEMLTGLKYEISRNKIIVKSFKC